MKFDPRMLEIPEPTLEFGFSQEMTHPKDGLPLYGPLRGPLVGGRLRVGVVATATGFDLYKRFVARVAKPIAPAKTEDPNHTHYPGFQAVFGIEWPVEPVGFIEIDPVALADAIRITDRHQAIHKAVSLYSEVIVDYLRNIADTSIDLWMVVIPEDVYRYCRPKSKVTKAEAVQPDFLLGKKVATRLLTQEASLFDEDNRAAEIYLYDLDFHNQLKARLLEQRAAVQVVRETTLAPEEFKNSAGTGPLRRLQDQATVAWNISTTTYFKAGGKPWQLANVRPGVCYVGIVLKQDSSNPEPGMVCCGAQMFLESGDGVVFKGTPGRFKSDDKKDEFHLPRDKAKALMELVVKAYRQGHGGQPPKELFIHGKTRFSREEWEGFRDTVPQETNVVCVRIREDSGLKMYRHGRTNIMRGLGWVKSERRGYLWSKGFVPRLQTYAGREVPSPLSIEISQGAADIRQVMADVLGLTKLNYNACIYGDGVPVTLRFADAVGEILTAAPRREELPPLPFRYYI